MFVCQLLSFLNIFALKLSLLWLPHKRKYIAILVDFKDITTFILKFWEEEMSGEFMVCILIGQVIILYVHSRSNCCRKIVEKRFLKCWKSGRYAGYDHLSIILI